MQKNVEIANGAQTLRGAVHIPDGATEKVPVVCFFHGLTSSRMETRFIFVRFSRLLEQYGIGSIRVDFAGSGESDGDFQNMTPMTELEDAKVILNYVRTLEWVDTERIALLGRSLGGAVSSMLAGVYKEYVKALCMWAPAVNIKELYLSRNVGKTDLIPISKAEEDKIMKQGYRDLDGLVLGGSFFNDSDPDKILNKAKGFEGNVLIVHGTEAVVVPCSNSVLYENIYGTKCKKILIEGCDHVFGDLVWERELFEHSLSFLRDNLA